MRRLTAGRAPLDFRFLDIMIVLLLATSGAAMLAFYVNDNSASEALRVTSTIIPDAMVAHPYRLQLTAAGGRPPLRWSAEKMPPGLDLRSDGTFDGAPSAPGKFAMSVAVTDSAGARAIADLALEVAATGASVPLRIVTRKLPLAYRGKTYDVTLAAEGGLPPYVWRAAELPEGMALEGMFLTGTPKAAGVFPLALSVTDHDGTVGELSVDLQVLAGGAADASARHADLRVSSVLPAMIDNRPYTVQLSASGGTEPYQWRALSLTPRVTLSGSGLLRVEDPSAIPAGWSMEVKVYDADGLSAVASLTPRVAATYGTATTVLLALATVTGWILALLLFRVPATQYLRKLNTRPWLSRLVGFCLVFGATVGFSHWVAGTWLFVAFGVGLAIVVLDPG